MLDEEKIILLKKMVPKAILKAMTGEAKHSIIKREFAQDIIPIYNYPFKIGRESRVRFIDGEVVLQERYKLGGNEPNNDIYLLDIGEYLQISREHCSIIKNKDTTYTLNDRGSACGSMVNDTKVGGGDHQASVPLKDGDIISLGIENSPYKFKFIILDIEY